VRVATWNINNVVKRIDLLIEWLNRTRPDVVALQELKNVTEAFPYDALKAAGYSSLVVGQRSWNGVALLARDQDIVPVLKALPGDPSDKEARYVEAAIGGVLYGCLYLVNGNPQPGPKFAYKLAWFERMRQHAQELWDTGNPVVLLGDWNVVPTDADIYKPDTWREDALLQPETRAAFARVMEQGWTDAIGQVYAGQQVPFTFWDYRRRRWERDAGLRIDYILVSPNIEVLDAGVDKEERGKENASDHAPVWAELRQVPNKRRPTARQSKATSKKSNTSNSATPEIGVSPGEPTKATSKTPSKTSKSTSNTTSNTTAKSVQGGPGGVPDLSKAVKAAFPVKLEPQLATLTSGVPAGDDWVVENKFDGYRVLVRIDDGKASLITRNGNDWTTKLRSLAAEVERLGIKRAWLDGEMVVLNEHGVPDFNALQNAIDNSRSNSIVLYLFDVPFVGDKDLRAVPLRVRRQVLQQLIEGRASERVRFSEELNAAPRAVLEAACRLGLEGVMLKKGDAPYVGRRSETWLKLKCQRRQEFVVLGFTDRANSPRDVGAMLLGYYENGKLRYAGSVGTGWSSTQGAELQAKLLKLETKEAPVDAAIITPGRWSKRRSGAERWVKPTMVVEVAFGEWTPEGHVRHATFRGVRTDKPAKSIKREDAAAAGAPSRAVAAKAVSVKVSHPERVIDKSTGTTKLQLVEYYQAIAPWMLPHLKDRPVSLVRGPSGIGGELFFQKHSEARIPGMTELDPALWPGHDALLAVNTAEALVHAAQFNVIELHTWNSTSKRIDNPDRVIFDLDPGEGVTWAHVQEAALLTRGLLEQLGLEAWLKTSGGKGLHVVVPLAPKLDYETVKTFSQAVVQHMAKVIPQRFVAKSGGANRVGKIFVDYLRNGHGQTTAAAFSARARPGLGVSMPVAWEQLQELKSGAHWTIDTAPDYMASQRDDPWASYWKSKQTLTQARKLLGK
jgi:bifunctional non-homologous end joining protein LigD